MGDEEVTDEAIFYGCDGGAGAKERVEAGKEGHWDGEVGCANGSWEVG